MKLKGISLTSYLIRLLKNSNLLNNEIKNNKIDKPFN